MTSISNKVLDKLQQFDTPTICNVIELFDIRPRTVGFMDRRIQAQYPELPPMVGFASTVTCRTAIQPRGTDAYTELIDQIENFKDLSGPPVVVFQDLDDPPVAATFGEIMCTTYKTFGAVGLVTNGGGRDLEQVRSLHFPVFTDGAVCSHGYIHMLDVHIPVRLGGMTVYPDDLLHGDLNGVTMIPKSIAADVAEIASEFVAAEQIILDALRAPSVSRSTVRAAIAEADAQIAELRHQVAKRS